MRSDAVWHYLRQSMPCNDNDEDDDDAAWADA
jgi:hypothetical protein